MIFNLLLYHYIRLSLIGEIHIEFHFNKQGRASKISLPGRTWEREKVRNK